MQLLSPLVDLHLHRSNPAVWVVTPRPAHDVMRAPSLPCQLGPLVQTLSFRPVYFLCKAKQNLYLEKGARHTICGPSVAAEEPILALACSGFPSDPREVPSNVTRVPQKYLSVQKACVVEEGAGKRGEGSQAATPSDYNPVSRDPHERGQLAAKCLGCPAGGSSAPSGPISPESTGSGRGGGRAYTCAFTCTLSQEQDRIAPP